MIQASPRMFEESNTWSTLYFTIEGNIGCGKSTFLQALKQRIPELVWIEQPVADWQSLGAANTNMLQRYYNNPQRWGFTFQIYALFTRLQKMQESCQNFPTRIKITERSILADKYVFSTIMKDLEYMDASEYEIFKSLYNSFQKMAPITNARVVYLRCSPQKCHERTVQRKREEQKEIPLEYLQMVHDKHEKWFAQFDPKQVLVIDTSEDFKGDEKKIGEMVDKLVDFIRTSAL